MEILRSILRREVKMQTPFQISIILFIFLVISSSIFSLPTHDGISEKITNISLSGFPKIPENNCSANMFFSFVSHSCQCKEFYIYMAWNKTCELGYRQGFCPVEHYLVLPPGEKFPRCEKNPCLQDGLVPFGGNCTKLGSYDPCISYGTYLTIDSKSSQLICSVIPQLPQGIIINAPPKVCPYCYRRSSGTCRKVILNPGQTCDDIIS